MSLILKFPVLLLQNLLVVVKEPSKVVKLRVFQYLKALESGSNLFWCRYFLHLRDRLCKQVVLALYHSFVVT